MADDLRSRHRKELKALEGEKRSALKKSRGTAGKGKKGKEALSAVEREYATREAELSSRHAAELAALAGGAAGDGAGGGGGGAEEEEEEAAAAAAAAAPSVPAPAASPASTSEDSEQARRRERQDKAREKARKKREKAREKERRRDREIAEELAAAGPPPREVEVAAMRELYLDPAGLTIREVQADGNCLYRAVAEQCDLGDYGAVRAACADTLLRHEEEFAPFSEHHDHGSYEKYVERVRSSSDWGGHLELRALSRALRRRVVVYSAEAAPLRMGEEFSDGEGEEIRVSYHRKYYDLGEHYNSVVPK